MASPGVAARRGRLAYGFGRLPTLDVYNGILLAPNLDAAFDRGLITVADDGALVVSDALEADARSILGLDRPLRVRGLTDGHRAYLPWHRDRVFQARAKGGQTA